jgi:hypothetical protein
VEHIVALQHAGQSREENLALSCDRCNAFKGPNLTSIDPDSGDVVLLFHPRRDQWDTHFDTTDGYILGRTAAGRATVRLLQMNVPRRVELRQLLEDDPEH